MYDTIKSTIQSGMDYATGQPGSMPILTAISAGAFAGISGAAIASPFFLIKTRMQAYSKGSSISIGFQHTYVEKGTIHSLKTIYRSEKLRGLWRGVDASMLRTGIGSSVQLPCYEFIKHILSKYNYFTPDGNTGSLHLHFAASLGTSLAVCTAMNPFDVAMTRMYNQKDGLAYKNVFDCIVKTVRVEGLQGNYI